MNKKMAAPIDNKNVMEDFIYDEIFDNGYIETPQNKGKIRNIIGYYNGKLLEARWTFGSNRLCFAFLSTMENYADNNTEAKNLMLYFNEINNNNENLAVNVGFSGNWLLCDFYWKNED